MYDVVAIGELLDDFTADRIQEDGYPVMAAHPGGAPANFLAALAKYGKLGGIFSVPERDHVNERYQRLQKGTDSFWFFENYHVRISRFFDTTPRTS